MLKIRQRVYRKRYSLLLFAKTLDKKYEKREILPKTIEEISSETTKDFIGIETRNEIIFMKSRAVGAMEETEEKKQ